jgi:hypothetical protein
MGRKKGNVEESTPVCPGENVIRVQLIRMKLGDKEAR